MLCVPMTWRVDRSIGVPSVIHFQSCNARHQLIFLRDFGIGIPSSQHMIPGKTYVGRLPGHSRKTFVRKREFTGEPLSDLAGADGARSYRSKVIHKAERGSSMPRWLKSMFGSDYYDDRYRRRRAVYTDGAHQGSSAGRPVTNISQVCSSCGKFRSPSWSARHPLRYGEVPRASMCRKCARKSTSSEQPAYPRRYRRHHHRRSRHLHSDYTDDPYSSYDSRDPGQLRRRYRSDSLGYIRPRSLVRSGSGERVNIIIRNEGYRPKTQVRTLSSSEDLIHVTRHVSVDKPVRRRVMRSDSLDPVYIDEDLEELVPTRRPLRRAR